MCHLAEIIGNGRVSHVRELLSFLLLFPSVVPLREFTISYSTLHYKDLFFKFFLNFLFMIDYIFLYGRGLNILACKQHFYSLAHLFYVVPIHRVTYEKFIFSEKPHLHEHCHTCAPRALCTRRSWARARPQHTRPKENGISISNPEIPRQLQYICLYLVHIAGAYLLNLSRLGLVLLLLQYSTEFLFHMLFNAWAAVFGITHLFILTLAVLAIGFGLARMENQAFDPEKGNFNTLLCRLCVLLLVCAAQAWLMWRFIHSQLRRWREYWKEQSAKRRVPAAPRLPARLIKRESGYHENGVVKAENGTSPRTKKLKSP
ncbi:unnamed protein product [Nyctereutes procyonoides]|uniref:(raccoon dog) hypothetical protein n=1 Tax=Nyctereutes procyonoides TaxID=34880 RepID=A0A811Z7Q3_NYCPR|nr:unnamed protein product [Nyctereutes procyonoides]